MKFKKIPPDYFHTIIDRLTRFEPAYLRFQRVVNDIINKYFLSISSQYSQTVEKIKIAEEIFNSSLDDTSDDFYINDVLYEMEDKYFYPDELSYQYLSNRFNISQMIKEIPEDRKIISKNVFWIKTLNENRISLQELRYQKELLYPVEKIFLCEGMTEFNLLKPIFNLFGMNFDKLGFLTIPAGGKNQVARKYFEMSEYTKLPFFILLDNDAKSIAQIIKPRLRKYDKLYLLKSGEFEDLIPAQIIINALNLAHCNDYNCKKEDLSAGLSMVENIELIYKKYGFGEFKKARFALILNEYIKQYAQKNDFLKSEIVQIKSLL